MNRNPDVQLNVWFSEIGLEWSLYVDSHENLRAGQCRDFSGSYPVENSEKELAEILREVIERFRRDR